MSITLSALQKQRRDTAANWTAENPTLLAGEIGLESDTGYWKVGDGATAWTSLAYVSGLGAEIPVDRLADGAARQLLQTDAAGTGVEWTDDIDVPGTLDVTGAATFDDDVTIQGDLTVNGTTTTIDTTTLVVEDKNIEIGKVATPTDVTADGGGITLKGDTDKTINWIDATNAWTSSERFSYPLGSAADPALTFTGDPNTGIYSPGADQVAISTNGTGRLFVDASGNVQIAGADTQINPGGRLLIATSVTNAGTSLRAIPNGTGTSSALQVGNSNDVANQSIGSLAVNDTEVTIFSAVNGTGTQLPLLFNVGGERLRITSDGKVGIGTSSPLTCLHLRSAAGTDQLRWTDDTNSTAFLSTGTASSLIYTNTALAFGTGSATFSEKARIDSSGRLLVGTSSARQNYYNLTSFGGSLQIEGVSGGGSRMINLTNNSTGNDAPLFVFAKSDGGSLGSNTLVSSGTGLGEISFQGSDGAEFVQAAAIQALVDGTPGSNDMPGRLVFATTADGASSPTERMRISSNPDNLVLIGQASNPATSTLCLAVRTGTANGVNAQITSNTGTSYPWSNYNASGTYVGGITCTSTATSFPTSSDYRLKQNVQPLANAAALLAQLKPSTFEFKEDAGTQVQGFIAHELQEVVPLAVVGEKDAEDADGNPIYQGVDAAKLVPLLTAALQEALAEIESLKARVTALEP